MQSSLKRIGDGKSTATHARAGGLVPKKVAYTAFILANRSMEERKMLMFAQWERLSVCSDSASIYIGFSTGKGERLAIP
jgi:hypothetical protein